MWEFNGTATRSGNETFSYDVSPVEANVPDEIAQAREEYIPAVVQEGASDAPVEPPVDPNDPESWTTKLNTLEPVAFATTASTTGRLIVETTKWGLIQRPDYCAVVYQIGSETPLRVVSGVPSNIIGNPEHALFVIGANNQQIAINATQKIDVATTLVGYLIHGIFAIHEKAIGWVIKRL